MSLLQTLAKKTLEVKESVFVRIRDWGLPFFGGQRPRSINECDIDLLRLASYGQVESAKSSQLPILERKLLDALVNLIAETQIFSESPSGKAAVLADRFNQMIADARLDALTAGHSSDDFHDALFPVIAWIDERVSLLHSWDDVHAWQDFLLQRRHFGTTLAGVEFFERLSELPAESVQVREVFLMCLCLRFVGKFNNFADAAELDEIRMMQYRIFQQQNNLLLKSQVDGILFYEAYQKESDPVFVYEAFWKKWLTLRNLLVIGLPVVTLIIMVSILAHMLGESIDAFRKATQL